MAYGIDPVGAVAPRGPSVVQGSTTTNHELFVHVDNEFLSNTQRGEFRRYSNALRIAGVDWKLMVRFNVQDKTFDTYLGVQKTEDTDDDFCMSVNASFQIICPAFPNQKHGCRQGDLDHQYSYLDFDEGGYVDRGFTGAFNYAELKQFFDADIPTDLYFRCTFYETKRFNFANYSSRDATGMVGLENLGATCYLNALLQMLYHINDFQRAVFEIPVNEDDTVTSSTTLALQSVFYNLKCTEAREVSTKDLTKAFGWNSLDAFMQQDVQEMMRVLLDKLEEKMKGSSVEEVIKKLFCGRVKSYIRCTNIDYESSREEDFYDIQLDVKGCDNIQESFRKYIEKEMLDGENKYDAESYGKQDAEKGVIFIKFPPVLTIHLKRFTFEIERMRFAKVHDSLEFPSELCLDEFLDPNTTRDPSDGPNDYILHSVLVHAGDVNGGHYYAYIRPNGCGFWDQNEDSNSNSTARTLVGKNSIAESDLIDPAPDFSDNHHMNKEGEWFKFDDETVIEVTKEEAIDRCFGRLRGSQIGVSSAYMLVYIRKSEAVRTMKIVHPTDIPRSLVSRLTSVNEGKQADEHEEMMKHHYMSVAYFTENEIANFDGFNTGQHFLSDTQCRTIDVLKSSSWLGICHEFSRELDLPLYAFRIWTLSEYGDSPFRIEFNMCDYVSQGCRSKQEVRDKFVAKLNADGDGFCEVPYLYIQVVEGLYDEEQLQDYHERKIAPLELMAEKWLEEIRAKIGSKHHGMTFDVAEGYGVGRGVYKLAKRLSVPSDDPFLQELKNEYHSLDEKFMDLYMGPGASLFHMLYDFLVADHDRNKDEICFLRIYDPDRKLEQEENFHYKYACVDHIPCPYVSDVMISCENTPEQVHQQIRTRLEDFFEDRELPISWENFVVLRLAHRTSELKKFIMPDYCDLNMSNLRGSVLIIIQNGKEASNFVKEYNELQWSKLFIVKPFSTPDNSRVLKHFHPPTLAVTGTKALFEETGFENLHIYVNISCLDVYVHVSRLLGINYRHLKLRVQMNRRSVQGMDLAPIPIECDEKKKFRDYLLGRSNDKSLSDAFSLIVFQIVPEPLWIDYFAEKFRAATKPLDIRLVGKSLKDANRKLTPIGSKRALSHGGGGSDAADSVDKRIKTEKEKGTVDSSPSASWSKNIKSIFYEETRLTLSIREDANVTHLTNMIRDATSLTPLESKKGVIDEGENVVIPSSALVRMPALSSEECSVEDSSLLLFQIVDSRVSVLYGSQEEIVSLPKPWMMSFRPKDKMKEYLGAQLISNSNREMMLNENPHYMSCCIQVVFFSSVHSRYGLQFNIENPNSRSLVPFFSFVFVNDTVSSLTERVFKEMSSVEFDNLLKADESLSNNDRPKFKLAFLFDNGKQYQNPTFGPDKNDIRYIYDQTEISVRAENGMKQGGSDSTLTAELMEEDDDGMVKPELDLVHRGNEDNIITTSGSVWKTFEHTFPLWKKSLHALKNRNADGKQVPLCGPSMQCDFPMLGIEVLQNDTKLQSGKARSIKIA